MLSCQHTEESALQIKSGTGCASENSTKERLQEEDTERTREGKRNRNQKEGAKEAKRWKLKEETLVRRPAYDPSHRDTRA